MQVFGNIISPYYRHCHIAKVQAQLDWDFVRCDRATALAQSPAGRIPFLVDGDRLLSDSMSILRYLREQSGDAFFADIADFERFCQINALLDTYMMIHNFVRSGIAVAQSDYLQNATQRVTAGMVWLEATSKKFDTQNDADLRQACFLDWARFRQRIDLLDYPQLQAFLDQAMQYRLFAESVPESA